MWFHAITEKINQWKGDLIMAQKNKSMNIINMLCIATAFLVTLPLLLLGYFDYPFADDWSLGKFTFQAVKNGDYIVGILRQVVNTVILWREKGEPRFSAVFLAALQPGIWGEHFYRITPWIMIGSLFFAEILFCTYFFQDKERQNRKQILPVVIPSLLIQILCVPYPTETFYWYVGSVNYTFIFSLSLILLYLFLRLIENGMKKRKIIFFVLTGGVLAVIVGGNNYATSLSSACIFVSLSLFLLFKNKRAFFRTAPITFLTVVGLVICIVAPGNQVRLHDEFGGATTGVVYAISMSLWRTFTNIYSWTSLKIIIMMILIAPFMWKATGRLVYRFHYPVLFTVFTFGIYASQITATMYVDGSTGGGRMADILYYAYHVWVLLNEGYWLGWLRRRKLSEKFSGLMKAKTWIDQRLAVWFLTGGIILAGTVGILELKTLSTYRACVWLVKGYARDYAQSWEERLAVLKDDSVKEVYFDPLPGYQELVFYADLEFEWIEKACAEYYDKDFVRLK